MVLTGRAVFLSYAKQDAAAAARISTALREAGVEVWFDESELRGGDAWDAAIRRHIKACALFVPLVSRNTQARTEGYFRLEWKLAIDRSHLMAHDRAFLLPVAIDDTNEGDERVPDRFRELQWSRLPGGEPSPAFIARIRQLLEASDGGTAHAAAFAPPPAHSAAAIPGQQAGTTPRATVRPAWLWVLAGVLLLGGAGLWLTRETWTGQQAVAPYSAQDRRLTFAMLPFDAPADDADGGRVAAATQQALLSVLATQPQFAHMAASGTVEQAAAREASYRKLAQLLDVHFLIRGTVSRVTEGYSVNISVIDGESERVLRARSVAVAADAVTPRYRDDVEDIMYSIVFAALDEEARRADGKPVEQLDVRDLTFRAYSQWRADRKADGEIAYVSATDLLKKALAIAPEDPLAIMATANINLCDCVMDWAEHPEEQKAIGAAAVDRYLRIDPRSKMMLANKAELNILRGRLEEALVLAESLLREEPTSADGLAIKAKIMLRMGRAKDALPLAEEVYRRYPNDWADAAILVADSRYMLGDYAGAAEMARNATAQMTATEFTNPVMGPVRLTLIAAEARAGRLPQATTAREDFEVAVPQARTLTEIRKWMHATSNLAGFAPLFEGLRLAGIPD